MSSVENKSPPSRRAVLLGLGSKSEAAWSVILAWICLGSLLAYSLPGTPLDFAAGFVPGIDRLAERSSMPQVTRLFMSLQWMVFGPVCAVLFLKYGRPTKESMIRLAYSVRKSSPLYGKF